MWIAVYRQASFSVIPEIRVLSKDAPLKKKVFMAFSDAF